MNTPIVITAIVAALSLSAALISYAQDTQVEKPDHTEAAHQHNEASKDSYDPHATVSQKDDGHDHDAKQEAEHKNEQEEEGHDHDTENKAKHKDGDKDKQEDDGHGHGGAEEAASDAELSPAQLKQAGIETIIVNQQFVNQQITASAEVMLNQYRSAQITPKITAQVTTRFVYLGDQVKKGQKLVTLKVVKTPELAANVISTAGNIISIADLEAGLATARGEFQTADAEWKRVTAIGKDLISQKRIDEAKIARNQAATKVRAYKRSQKKMQGLLNNNSSRNSMITIVAPQAGTVINDNFVIGQVMQPGDVLFEISDIDKLWVEARIKPSNISKIEKGAAVTIKIAQQNVYGKVINIGRLLDEETKTLPVRIELDRGSTSLYPGQFVQAKIDSSETHSGLAVPSQAVIRSADGDWMVLLNAASGRFEPKEITIKQNLGDQIVIEGIRAGSKIVSKGAFFVQSEIAKSGFSVHNH